MSRIVVLGAAGGIGSVAARGLAPLMDIEEIRLADVDHGRLEQLAGALPHDAVTVTDVDATSATSLAQALDGADVVLNCVGPFYRFGPPVLRAAISAGVDYVDVCDDLAPTRVMLDMDAAAGAAGVTALIGMGNSPGLANVFARLCAEQFLDEVRSVDIMHVHGGEPQEGAAVIKHRIHAMTDPVPLYIDGEFVEVHQLGPDGQAHVREFDFRDVGPMNWCAPGRAARNRCGWVSATWSRWMWPWRCCNGSGRPSCRTPGWTGRVAAWRWRSPGSRTAQCTVTCSSCRPRSPGRVRARESPPQSARPCCCARRCRALASLFRRPLWTR